MHGAWLNYTIAALFKTSTDISSSQFVYEEGGGINGLNIYIRDRKVFCGAWIQVSDATTGNAHSLFLSIDIDVNKKYFVANVFEGKKQHSAFLNNVKYGRANISWKMLSHSGTCQFGRNSGDTVTDISVQNEANYSTRDSQKSNQPTTTPNATSNHPASPGEEFIELYAILESKSMAT